MELKSINSGKIVGEMKSSNCTFMELKYGLSMETMFPKLF